jgi:hypothetical protein
MFFCSRLTLDLRPLAFLPGETLSIRTTWIDVFFPRNQSAESRGYPGVVHPYSSPGQEVLQILCRYHFPARV